MKKLVITVVLSSGLLASATSLAGDPGRMAPASRPAVAQAVRLSAVNPSSPSSAMPHVASASLAATHAPVPSRVVYPMIKRNGRVNMPWGKGHLAPDVSEERAAVEHAYHAYHASNGTDRRDASIKLGRAYYKLFRAVSFDIGAEPNASRLAEKNSRGWVAMAVRRFGTDIAKYERQLAQTKDPAARATLENEIARSTERLDGQLEYLGQVVASEEFERKQMGSQRSQDMNRLLDKTVFSGPVASSPLGLPILLGLLTHQGLIDVKEEKQRKAALPSKPSSER